MKLVVNDEWGGFAVPKVMQDILHCERYPMEEDIFSVRTDKRFVNWVLTHADETSLAVVEIPDNATDWRIEDYDGIETVWVVVNGKMQRAEYEAKRKEMIK